jgi:hypothetical protein
MTRNDLPLIDPLNDVSSATLLENAAGILGAALLVGLIAWNLSA